MSVTEKKFMYIREEVFAEQVSNECRKMFEYEGRMPTQKEYKSIITEANEFANKLLKHK